MIGIYAIRNKINGKVYIGQSVNILQRWNDHKRRSRYEEYEGNHYPLYRAFKKYGVDNFEFILLEECNKNILNEREIYWIKKYNSYNDGYNATLGGGNSCTTSIKITEEEADNIKKLLMNTTLSQVEIAEKFNIDQSNVSLINIGKIWYNQQLKYPLRKQHGGKNAERVKNKKKKQLFSKCIDCGKQITIGAIRCVECHKKTTRKIEWPSKEELKQLIRTTSFAEIGRRYGVSDNTIRKWCDNYSLPRRVKDIKAMSDEEWNNLENYVFQGQDEKKEVDVELIIKIYEEVKNVKLTAEILDLSITTVSKYLKQNNIKIIPPHSRRIISINNKGEICYYNSIVEAAEFLIDNGETKTKNKRSVSDGIGRVLRKERENYLGRKWEYNDEPVAK